MELFSTSKSGILGIKHLFKRQSSNHATPDLRKLYFVKCFPVSLGLLIAPLPCCDSVMYSMIYDYHDVSTVYTTRKAKLSSYRDNSVDYFED